MTQQRRERLKPLLDDLPPGFVVEAAWLVARGIDRSRLNCVGLAGSRRVADDTEGSANASNRRVEIHLADEDL